MSPDPPVCREAPGGCSSSAGNLLLPDGLLRPPHRSGAMEAPPRAIPRHPAAPSELDGGVEVGGGPPSVAPPPRSRLPRRGRGPAPEV